MEKISLKTELYWKLEKNGISLYTYNTDLQKRLHVPGSKKFFKILLTLKNPKTIKEITSNSGSIFNALFMCLSVGKMIFDDIFQVRISNYAYADFFMNDYFIGNRWEYNLFYSFSSYKKSLNKYSYSCNPLKNIWISKINSQNFMNSKILVKPKLNQFERKYLFTATDYTKMLDSKKMYDCIKDISLIDDIKLSDIKPQLFNFVTETFDSSSIKVLEDIFQNKCIYTQRNRFDKITNLSFFNSGKPVIYSTEITPSIQKANILLHELFHSLLFCKTFNSYKQEDLVLKYCTLFLEKNRKLTLFKKLLISHLKSTLALYMNSFTAVQYEKLILTNNLRTLQQPN